MWACLKKSNSCHAGMERIGYKGDVFPNDANRDVAIIIHRKGNIEALRTGL